MKRIKDKDSNRKESNEIKKIINAVMQNRPKTSGGSSSFHSGCTRDDEKIKRIRNKRALMLKEAERKRMENYIKRNAKRHFKLKSSGMREAMKLTKDILGSSKNHFHIISPRSPHRPRKPKKESPLIARYERLKRTQATGGYSVWKS